MERSTGPLLGVDLGTRLGGKLNSTIGLRLGTLQLRTTEGTDRDVAELNVRGSYAVRPNFFLESGLTLRAYSAPAGRQRWTAVGLGAAARLPFGAGGAHGIVRAALLPLLAATGLPGPDLAFTAAAGMEYRRGRAALEVLYCLERYDFPVRSAVARREQLTTLNIGMRWNRGAGT